MDYRLRGNDRVDKQLKEGTRMKVLYGIEPDLCINNPQLVIDLAADMILPQFFYGQLNYLKSQDFEIATKSASDILEALTNQAEADSELLLFQSRNNGHVYFSDDRILNPLDFKINNFDRTLDEQHPIDRYLLSLLILSDILECQIVFITSSQELVRKCHLLQFQMANPETLSLNGESWLQPDIIEFLMVKLADRAKSQWEEENEEEGDDTNIQWQDDFEEVVALPSPIIWIENT
jgi:hypothetical protein